jgi:hypothetical protein
MKGFSLPGIISSPAGGATIFGKDKETSVVKELLLQAPQSVRS